MSSEPAGRPVGDGLRVVRLPRRSEADHDTAPVPSFGELKQEQYDLNERMLNLVASDPHLVDQMNRLLDQMQVVNAGFTRRVRVDANTKWQKRLDGRVEEAHREGRRDALSDWVHTKRPDEAIDHAAGRLVRLVLGFSGDSGKAAKSAMQALADLEGAWHAWARWHGLPDPDPADLDDPHGSAENGGAT